MSNEEWRNIEGVDGYQVSNQGNVRSKHVVGSKLSKLGATYHSIKPRVDGHGYLIVGMKGRNHKIHRLVAKAFLPNPSNLPVVRHLDDNRTNNNVSNLCWGTQKDNVQDCIRHGVLLVILETPPSLSKLLCLLHISNMRK